MSYYRTCPLCGAALDPGEKCDCQRYDRINPYESEYDEQEPAWPGVAVQAYREASQWQEENFQS